MTTQPRLLSPPINQMFAIGCSLKYAYQPASEAELKFTYDQHPCQACGQTFIPESVPDVTSFQVGAMVFKILPKPCSCGYESEMFVVTNDVVRHQNPAIVPAKEAIAQAEANHQLPDPSINTQLIAAHVAAHHGRYDDAIALNQQLSTQYPELFMPFLNLGHLYKQQERYPEALQAYSAVLARKPHHSGAQLGYAFALLQSDRCREAGIAYEQWRSQHPEGAVILARKEGLFGTIKIIDTPEDRKLCIDDQVQGMAYKSPTAPDVVSSCRSGPGPLSPNRFAAGFLLLGYTMRQAHGLVLGLGAGASIVMNLACFPEMRLTVVEIDPVIIQLCRTFFPLVDYYMEQGRLEIIEADAIAFLQANRCPFDFVQFDAYQGSPEVPGPFRSVEVIQQMGATAPVLFSNLIGKLRDRHFHQVLETFDQAEHPIHTLYSSEPIEGNEDIDLNWISTTYPVDVPDDFVPFASMTGTAVETIRENFRPLRHRAIPRETLRQWQRSFST